MFDKKSILITGGTGSFGKAWVRYILKRYKNIKRLVIFSRDELKQFEMQREFSIKKYPCMRYFIGDIRDSERLTIALRDIDFVIHAAALKQVPTAEYNPIETIKTNIIGAQNLIESSLKNEVKKLLLYQQIKQVHQLICMEQLNSAQINSSSQQITSEEKEKYLFL